MARHPFGGSLSDWAIVPDGSGLAVLTGGAEITAWNAQTAGTQYTDLATTAEGDAPDDHVTSSDGTDGLTVGQIPQFWGPDGVWVLWVSINGGPRVEMTSTDLGAAVDLQAGTVAGAISQVNTFAATLGVDNGIATLDDTGVLAAGQRRPFTLAEATDVDLSGVADGDMLVYDETTGMWVAMSFPGPWTSVTSFGAGIGEFAVTPAWRMVEKDVVQLVGRVQKTTVGATFSSGTVLCTLQGDAWPASTKYHTVAASANDTNGDSVRIDIGPDGTVTARWANPAYAPSWISFDGTVYDLGL